MTDDNNAQVAPPTFPSRVTSSANARITSPVTRMQGAVEALKPFEGRIRAMSGTLAMVISRINGAGVPIQTPPNDPSTPKPANTNLLDELESTHIGLNDALESMGATIDNLRDLV